VLENTGTGRQDERFFTFVYQPVRTNGQFDGVFIHAVDVTDQVRARSEAEAANRAKSEFLAAMSHELRTPLNAIGGYTQLFEMGLYGPVSPQQHEALERVQRSQQHLLALINDVLNFAKLEAGRVEYHVEDVTIADAINGVVHMIEPQLRAKGIACAVHPDATLRGRADRDKLEQILLNLLSNAIKFTNTGGLITIDTPTAQMPSEEFPAGLVFVRVSDTGCGIPRDKQDAIFDPFVQVHRRLTTPTEGTGLGLAISRDLARGMGGNLRVRSTEGAGSVFTLTLRSSDE
jgi:signal transduction histidine kinase